MCKDLCRLGVDSGWRMRWNATRVARASVKIRMHVTTFCWLFPSLLWVSNSRDYMFGRYVRTTPRVIDRYRYIYASYRLLSSTTASDKFSGYELVIGLEVHAQIKSRAKLFSRKCEITLDRRNSIDIKIIYRCMVLKIRWTSQLTRRRIWCGFSRNFTS